jgi:WD40 repeat protein
MRSFLIFVVIGIGTFVGITYLKPFQDDTPVQTSGNNLDVPPPAKGASPVQNPTPDTQSIGMVIVNPNARREGQAGKEEQIVIPNARMLPLDRQEVPSERDGKLLVLGTEILPGEKVPEERRFLATLGSLWVVTGNKEPSKTGPGERRWRRWQEGDVPLPGEIWLQKEKKEYKRLEVGDEVKAGQTVALVDPELAVNEVAIKAAALDAAESERRASVKTKEEAERRVLAMDNSRQRVPGSVSEDDYKGAILTARRYAEEEIAKRSAVIKAQQELIQAVTILGKHEIHCTIPGDIKVVYKNRGDAVKNLDPVLRIENRQRLRAEGLIDQQDAVRIRPGETEVIVEPSQPIRPKFPMEGHLGEVTCVAVSHGAAPIILSGGADSTLRAWTTDRGEWLWTFKHRSALRSLACTGPKAKRNLALVGCVDGSVLVFDLDRLDEFAKGKIKEQPEPRVLKARHRGAVHCVAVSPDGSMCATGGEDRQIILSSPETGEKLYELPACHRAPVTSLQFTPLKQLVSAGRDNQLVVWSVEADKPPVRLKQLEHRAGTVTQLGASPDGKQVLFDASEGKEIRLLSIESNQLEGVFRNASGAANFATMALFDPDGLTVLTNGGGAEGRLQLWRTPTPESTRAAELRQLVWLGSTATSAAFSPDGSLCVTGMQDGHVLAWPMPERKRDASGRAELLEKPIRSRIKMVEPYLEGSNGQERIWVELENKDNHLTPNGTATMVVLPDSK